MASRFGDGGEAGFAPGRHMLDAYGRGGFRFAGMSHRGSILILPSGIRAWSVTSPRDLSPADLAPILAEAERVEFVLIGTGADLFPLSAALRAPFREAGISIDAMQTGPAARTYNVLVAEDRRVAARADRGRVSAPVADGAAQAYAHCETLVRAQDPDRHYATLFAPAPHRPALFALYAFAQEIARVRDAVSSPLPGEIRLQWWRDALANEARGDVLANPVAAALDDAIARYRLPRAALSSLIDARVFDLYDDPMPSVDDLEGYLGETSSILIRLASVILADGGDPGPADAAGHAGVAYGIVGLLRALPWHARRGQLYIPRDMLERNGVTRDDVVLGRGGPGFVAALADMRALARTHFAAADALSVSVPAPVRSSYLVLALARGDLRAMERPGYDPFRTVVARPPWRTIATLWFASMRARVT